MKRVLLLGDSIRMGYQDYVKELLKDQCEVIYDRDDNGRFAAYTLWQAHQHIQKDGPFDLVHWNNGYWDMNIESPLGEAQHPIDEYLHFLRRIIRVFRSQNTKIVFATTTPILEDGCANDVTNVPAAKINYRNQWVVDYNTAARELMAQEQIPVNDLYALCMEDPRYYKCSDLLHLTEEGYRRCAQQIARVILREL